MLPPEHSGGPALADEQDMYVCRVFDDLNEIWCCCDQHFSVNQLKFRSTSDDLLKMYIAWSSRTLFACMWPNVDPNCYTGQSGQAKILFAPQELV